MSKSDSSVTLSPVEIELLAELCTANTDSFFSSGVRYSYTQGGGQSKLLLVAHADTVFDGRGVGSLPCVQEGGKIVSGGLDDRLGIFIARWLMKHFAFEGVSLDMVITRDEESANSSLREWLRDNNNLAESYNCIIGLDKGGLLPTMYHYEDYTECSPIKELARAVYGRLNGGSYSDISSIIRSGIGCINLPVGYTGAHTEQCAVTVGELEHCIRLAVEFIEGALNLNPVRFKYVEPAPIPAYASGYGRYYDYGYDDYTGNKSKRVGYKRVGYKTVLTEYGIKSLLPGEGLDDWHGGGDDINPEFSAWLKAGCKDTLYVSSYVPLARCPWCGCPLMGGSIVLSDCGVTCPACASGDIDALCTWDSTRRVYILRSIHDPDTVGIMQASFYSSSEALNGGKR